MNVFQILVLGICAIALVYLGASFFGLLPVDSGKEIEGLLKEGVVKTEDMFVKEISFVKNSVFLSSGFKDKIKSVQFYCLGDECCSEEDNCSGIFAEKNRVVFKRDMKIWTYVKCNEYEEEYKCLIGFGKKPAYVKILKAEFSGKREIKIEYEIENPGEEDLFQIILEIRGIEVYKDGKLWKKGNYEIEKAEVIEVLKKGEKKGGSFVMSCLGLEEYWSEENKDEKCITNKNYEIVFRITDYKGNRVEREEILEVIG